MRTNVTKKALSLLLSCLMVVSCCTAAFPSMMGLFGETAYAANTGMTDVKTAVTKAITLGFGDELKANNSNLYQLSGAGSTARTITDKTGVILPIVKALANAMKANATTGTGKAASNPAQYNTDAANGIDATTWSDDATQNANIKAMLKELAKFIVEYSSASVGFQYSYNSPSNQDREHDAGTTNNDNQYNNVPGPDALPAPQDYTITVKCTAFGAALWADNLDVTSVETQFKINLNNEYTYRETSRWKTDYDHKEGCNTEKHYVYHKTWARYYYVDSFTVGSSTSSSVDLSGLKAFINYFAGGENPRMDVDPYEAFTGDTAQADLQAWVNADNEAYEAYDYQADATTKALTNWYGNKAHANFVNALEKYRQDCADALNYYAYKPKVQYLKDHLLDETALDSTKLTLATIDPDYMTEADALALYNDLSTNYYQPIKELNHDSIAYEKLVSIDHYDEGAVEAKLALLWDYISYLKVAALKKQADDAIALVTDDPSNVAAALREHTTGGTETEPVYTYTVSTAGVTNLKTELAGVIAALKVDDISDAALNAVFGDGFAGQLDAGTDYISVAYNAADNELQIRGAEDVFSSWKAYYEPIATMDLIGLTANELIAKYEAGLAKFNGDGTDENPGFAAVYNQYKTLLAGSDDHDAFEGYSDRIQALLKTLTDQLQNNLIAKVNHAMDVTGAGTAEITLENFSVMKAAVDRVKSDYTNVVKNADEGTYYLVYEWLHNKNKTDLLSAATHTVNGTNYRFGDENTQGTSYYIIMKGDFSTKYDRFVENGGLEGFRHRYHYNSNNGKFDGTAVYNIANGKVNDYGTKLVREPEDADLGRGNGDFTDETYTVTKTGMEKIVTQLDTFLKSDNFVELITQLTADEETPAISVSLDKYVMKMLGDMLFTDSTMNSLIGKLYPMIVDKVQGLLDENLPIGLVVKDWGFLGQTKITGRKSLRDIASTLGLQIYPNQVLSNINSTFIDVRSKLNKNTWPEVLNADGEFVADWGMDTILLENYNGDYTAWFNAKADRFKLGLSNALQGLWGILQPLMNGNDKTFPTVSDIATVNTLNAKPDLVDMKLTGYAGYNKLVVPLLQDLGVPTHKANGEELIHVSSWASNNLNSAAALVNALFDPIKYFVTDVLAKAPLSTILEILPQLVYGISFDRLNTLIGGVGTYISGKVTIGGALNIEVYNLNQIPNTQPLKLGALIDIKDLIKNIDSELDISDLNKILGFALKKIGGEKLEGIELPPVNVGEILYSANLNRNATYRTGGTYNKFTTDKADLLYTILAWVAQAFQDQAFFHKIVGMISSSDQEQSGIVKKLLDGLETAAQREGGTEKFVTALVELFDPYVNTNYNNLNALYTGTTYLPASYTWWSSANEPAESGVQNLTAAQSIYLKYANDWNYTRATAAIDNIDEILNKLFENQFKEELGEDGTFGKWLETFVNRAWSNEAITTVVRLLATVGNAVKSDMLRYLLSKVNNGFSLTPWYDAFGSLFVDTIADDEGNTGEAPTLNDWTTPDAVPSLNGLSVKTNPDFEPEYNTQNELANPNQRYVWRLNGQELEDGNREAFTEMLAYVLDGMAPMLNAFLSGEDVTLFKYTSGGALLTVKGSNGYDSAIIPLFEALGITGMKSQAEFNALGSAQNKINYLFETAFDYVEEILESVGGDDNSAFVKKLLQDVVPNLLYFLQSNGLSTMVRNLLQPVLTVIDTLRPALGMDSVNDLLNDLVGQLIDGKEILGQTIDVEANPLNLDIKDLSLFKILDILGVILGLDVTPLKYGIASICAVDTAAADSASTVCQVNGTKNKRLTLVDGTGEEGHSGKNDPANVLTILLSLVLDLIFYGDNTARLDEMLGGLTVGVVSFDGLLPTLKELVRNAAPATEYLSDPDWFYFNDGSTSTPGGSITYTPDFNGEVKLPVRSIYYLRYANDFNDTTTTTTPDQHANLWTEELAVYMTEALNTILAKLLPQIEIDGQKYDNLGDLLNAFWKDGAGLYNKKTINAIATVIRKNVVPALEGFEKLLNVFLGLDVNYWNETAYPDPENDPEGTEYETYTAEEFVAEFIKLLKPLDGGETYDHGILSWLIAGMDMRFFHSIDPNLAPDDSIVIKGGDGYGRTIVPLLEAFGVEAPAASAVQNLTGSQILGQALTAILTRINTIITSDDPLDELVAVLPNLIYFINANGLVSSILNLLAPVAPLAMAFAPMLLGTDSTQTDPDAPADDRTPYQKFVDLVDELIGKFDKDGKLPEWFTVGNLRLVEIVKLVEFFVPNLHITDSVSMPVDTWYDGEHQIQTSPYNYFENLFIGVIEKVTSANGRTAFRMTYKPETENTTEEGARIAREGKADITTILIYTILDIFNNPANEEFLNGLLANANTTVAEIKELMHTVCDTYEGYNWFYFDTEAREAYYEDATSEGYTALVDDIKATFAGTPAHLDVDPAYTTMAYLLDGYLKYQQNEDDYAENLWNVQVASAFKTRFYDIVNMIVKAAAKGIDGIPENAETADDVIKALWNNGEAIYTEKLVYTVAKTLDDLLKAVDDLLGNQFYSILESIDAEFDAETWKAYIDAGEPANPTVYADRTAFVTALTDKLKPLSKLLDWFLVGEENALRLFYLHDSSAAITVGGSNGFEMGLVPILEALGCEVTAADIADQTTGIKALTYTLDTLLERVEGIINGGNALKDIVDLLPNLVYFINANGLSVAVKNVFGALANVARKLPGDLDVFGMIDLSSIGLTNLNRIDLKAVCEIVKKFAGVDIYNAVGSIDGTQNYLDSFAIGKVEPYTSANGDVYYKMSYNDAEGAKSLDSIDVFTIVVSSLIDVFKFTGNKDFWVGILKGENGTDEQGEEMYNAILALMNTHVTSEDYAGFDWFYYNDSVKPEGDPAWPVDISQNTTVNYILNGYLNYTDTNLWNKDTRDVVAASLTTLVDQVVELITKDNADLESDSLAELLPKFWKNGEGVYTAKNVYAIGKAIGELVGKLDAETKELIEAFVDIDLDGWAEYSEAAPETVYTKDQFVDALMEVFAPLVDSKSGTAILDWLLVGEDKAINLFYNKEGTGAISIGGGNGFKKGLVPLAEALGVQFTTAQVNAVTTGEQALRLTLTNILTRVEEIINSSDPIREITNLLPGLIYYVNANGASVSVLNLLAPVKAIVGTVGAIVPSILNGATVEGKLNEILNGALELEGANAVNFCALDLGEIAKLVNAKLGLDIIGPTSVERDGESVNYLANFAIGQVDAYASGSGETLYKMSYKTTEEFVDTLTLLVCSAISMLKAEQNKDFWVEKLFKNDEAKYQSVLALLNGTIGEISYVDYDWFYFDSTWSHDEFPNVGDSKAIAVSQTLEYCLKYRTADANNWNQETAQYVKDYFYEILDEVVKLAIKNDDGSAKYEGVNDLLNKAWSGTNLYSANTVNAIGKLVGETYGKLEGIIKTAVGIVLGVDDHAWDAYINAGESDETYTREVFVDKLVEIFAPAGNLLTWLLVGENNSLDLLYDVAEMPENAAKPAISIAGHDGMRKGLLPILEAFGCDTSDYTSVETGLDAMRYVINKLLGKIDTIAAADDAAKQIIALVPELLYFINTNGLSVSVRNLVEPVTQLVTAVLSLAGKDDELIVVNGRKVADLGKLLKLDTYGADLNNLTLEGIFNIVKHFTGIEVNAASTVDGVNVLKTFAIGLLTRYKTYSFEPNTYKMSFRNDELDSMDTLSVLLAVVANVFEYEGNDDALTNLIVGEKKDGETDAEYAQRKDDLGKIFDIVHTFLNEGTYEEKMVSVEEYKWLFAPEREGEVFAPFKGNTGATFNSSIYGPLYTREMGEYITKYFPLFVDTWITLLGVEKKDGGVYKNLKQMLNDMIGSTIYTNENLQKILTAIQDLVKNLKDMLGTNLYNHAAQILDKSLGVNVAIWDNYQLNTITEGNQQQFIAEIVRMLQPAYPILEWLLVGKDIRFFNDFDGTDLIVIKGADGYKDSIIPILEALKCNNILTQEAYAAAVEADQNAVLSSILKPLLDRVDEILENPIDNILEQLPALVYFLNSDGLDTAVRNMLQAVYTLLTIIEPALKDTSKIKDEDGRLNVLKLANIDLKDISIADIINKLIEGINENEDSQFDLTGVADDAIAELSLGKLRGFDSLRGKHDYTMDYVESGDDTADRVDMATVVMRLFLRFISNPQNVKALEAMLKGKLNEDGYKFVCALLENFGQMASSDDGMDKIMYTVYYIFYAALNAGVATNNGLAEFNGNYSFLNQLFATSNVGFLRQLEQSFGDLLNKWTPDVVDEDEVVPNGFIRFFRSIGDFFRRIIAWFQNLFK